MKSILDRMDRLETINRIENDRILEEIVSKLQDRVCFLEDIIENKLGFYITKK